MSLKERWEAAMVPNYATPPLTLVRGEGAKVWDAEGRAYTDLLAGVAVNALGHAHPAVVAAVRDQVARIAHTSNLYANEPALRLAERLQAKSGGHKVLWQNSGTEANEAALKAVRRHAHAQGMPDGVVVAFENSFHGRTSGSLALTGQSHYHEGFQPLPGQIVHVPFNDPAALEAAFSRFRVAGTFVESVQGEGGVTPLSPDAARAISRLTSQNGALLVADEVQTGAGRTGTFFGFEQDGLRPDAITMAKGIGGGLPLGALLLSSKAASLLGPGSHGCTFGGNAVACAAGNAVLDVLERDGLAARARRLGDAFRADLASRGVQSRGRGLLIGVPLAAPKAPEAVTAMREAGFLVGQAGKSVVRLAPPLVIREAEWMAAAAPLAKAVAAKT